MFEKEAEEYYYKTYPVTLNIGEEERYKEVTDIWKDGAEFGYNKANEWHYVKDGDLPNNTDNVLSDKGTIVYYNFTYDCWVDERTSVKIDDVIAWCEIPKFNVVVL